MKPIRSIKRLAVVMGAAFAAGLALSARAGSGAGVPTRPEEVVADLSEVGEGAPQEKIEGIEAAVDVPGGVRP